MSVTSDYVLDHIPEAEYIPQDNVVLKPKRLVGLKLTRSSSKTSAPTKLIHLRSPTVKIDHLKLEQKRHELYG